MSMLAAIRTAVTSTANTITTTAQAANVAAEAALHTAKAAKHQAVALEKSSAIHAFKTIKDASTEAGLTDAEIATLDDLFK